MTVQDLEALTVHPAYARDQWVHAHMFGAGITQKATWDAAIKWVIATQLTWEEQTDYIALNELRKGNTSIFFPLFEADPHITADCAGCGMSHVFDKEGICDTTGWEIS